MVVYRQTEATKTGHRHRVTLSSVAVSAEERVVRLVSILCGSGIWCPSVGVRFRVLGFQDRPMRRMEDVSNFIADRLATDSQKPAAELVAASIPGGASRSNKISLHRHVARRPDSAAGAALRRRHSLWWQTLQCICEAHHRPGDWRHPAVQNWSRLPESMLSQVTLGGSSAGNGPLRGHSAPEGAEPVPRATGEATPGASTGGLRYVVKQQRRGVCAGLCCRTVLVVRPPLSKSRLLNGRCVEVRTGTRLGDCGAGGHVRRLSGRRRAAVGFEACACTQPR